MLKKSKFNRAARIFVDVSGGVVQQVSGLPKGCTSTVIDWDNIEADPKREWDSFDEIDRAYIRKYYKEEYRKFFASLDN